MHLEDRLVPISGGYLPSVYSVAQMTNIKDFYFECTCTYGEDDPMVTVEFVDGTTQNIPLSKFENSDLYWECMRKVGMQAHPTLDNF
jgi:hypothetical protein